MAFNISIVNGLPDVREFNTDTFKRLIYTHLPFLRELYLDQAVTATAHQGLIWKGDLYGLLGMLGVSPKLYWVVLAINGYTDPCDYDGTKLTFIIPSESDIMSLAARDNTLDSEPR